MSQKVCSVESGRVESVRCKKYAVWKVCVVENVHVESVAVESVRV